jgi:hypothetical protein
MHVHRQPAPIGQFSDGLRAATSHRDAAVEGTCYRAISTGLRCRRSGRLQLIAFALMPLIVRELE